MVVPALLPQPVTQLVTLHLGALHPVEQVLTYVLAFGPFVVLALLVVVRRRTERAEQDAPPAPPAAPAPDPGPAHTLGKSQRDR